MESIQELINCARQFELKGSVINVEPYGEGHINVTYLVTTDEKKYILQKMNTHTFPDTERLMQNICAVTEFLRSAAAETLTVIPTKEGKTYLRNSACWRIYEFIEGTVTYQKVTDEKIFRNTGKAFGMFQNYLASFDATCLTEIIPHFHDTVSRFNDFKKALAEDYVGRKDLCKEEIQFVLNQSGDIDRVVNGLAKGEIPVRVTHNDTKLNNILIDAGTGEARAIIDLDTVMPGSLLYDFGDSIRFGASTAAEDERDLSKVHFSLSLFKAYAEGYCKAVKDSITDDEKELLPYSAYLMMTECGMRFLTDYLCGDIYFNIAYPDHNLIRARTQFKLAQETKNLFEEMHKIINEII